jgi:hypothetical protein
MSDDKRIVPINFMKSNIINIDTIKLKRLHEKGHLPTMVDQYQLLRTKFIYNKDMTKEEALQFVTLVKYFMHFSPSEALKIDAEYMFTNYIEPYGL